MGCFLSQDKTLTSLPLHGDVVRLTDWQLANLAFGSVSIITGICGSVINIEFKVEQRSANFGVDKWHLIRGEILNQLLGVFGVEPHLSI